MIAARRLAIVCAISCALAAPACGRYGPPVRATPSNPAADDTGLLDNARDETMPFVLEGLEDVDPARESARKAKGEASAEKAPAGEGDPAP